MTPEEQQQKTKLEQEIAQEFSQTQKDLELLLKEYEIKKQENGNEIEEKNGKIQEIKQEFDSIKKEKIRLETMTSLQEEKLNALKTRLESLKDTVQNIRTEIIELRNQKTEVPTTYELLKSSGRQTYTMLINIISTNSKEFKDVPGDTAEKKLEYIFSKIRENLNSFLKNKLGKSENVEKVITNTIAPAFERSLMELLCKQKSKNNASMLEEIKAISWENLQNLFSGVLNFASNIKKPYGDFSQWMNAIDYLSVHNGVLENPNKSEVLSNPLKFKEYMNNDKFKAKEFSPYTEISGNIFKVDENQTFEFGISLQEKQTVLLGIGDIQIVNNSKTTSIIVELLNKPEKFFKATSGLQDTANHLLDFVDFINPFTKIWGVDIFKEIKSGEKSLAYKALDFVCKLIGITGGLEGIVKKWRMDRMNLTNKKNENIAQIFKEYKELAGEKKGLNITDESSCKTALNDFVVTDLDKESSTKGDFLRDSIAENMDISLVSPAVIQHTLGNSYLKQTTQNGVSTYIVDESKFDEENKTELMRDLAQKHLENMKEHLEEYNKNDLSEFYTNIKSTEDLASCIIASLYVDKDDMIEGVKAKVFLPENYGTVHSNGTVGTNGTDGGNNGGTDGGNNGGTDGGTDSGNDGGDEQLQTSREVSQYQLSPGEYPFKNVPPYRGISTYDLRNVKMKPLLNYRDLVRWHENSVTLSGSNITKKGKEYPSNSTTGNKNNNPCDISHSSSDIGYIGYSIVADGQKLAKYDTPTKGIASAMRLLKNKYKNKSVTEINVGGYQGYYKPNEEIGLSALRIKWITDLCNALGIGPHQMLNLDDPTTLKSFVAQIAVLETGTHIGKELLDDAYNLAFT